jgi:hypothetical protein
MALVESITWDSEPKSSLLYTKDHAALRYKFRLLDSSNGPYIRPGRLTGELTKLSVLTIPTIAASDWGVPIAVQTRK